MFQRLLKRTPAAIAKPAPPPVEQWRTPDLSRRADGIPRTLISTAELGRHIAVLEQMDRITRAEGTQSHTTERFRYELLYFLLDNPGTGPIIEVGTMYGGVTCMFAYVAAVTGRHVFAIDIDHPRELKTRETCERFGMLPYVSISGGTLDMFVKRGAIQERPDLVFIDSAHDYNTTMEELRAIHGQPFLPRCLAFHDFNYRQGKQAALFDGELAQTNPIAIDRAFFDFYATYQGPLPLFKRSGGLVREGGMGTKSARGSMMDDYVDDHGSEAMMALYP